MNENFMQQAKDMQENLKKIQDDINNAEVTGESGGGLVKVVLSGDHEVKKIDINPSVYSDKEMLSDLIAAAFNDGVKKIKELNASKLSKAVGNNLSGMLKNFLG